MNVFFLAAGLGARLRPLTNHTPKPCIPFMNVPLGFFQFRFLQNIEITSCAANSFHLPDKIASLYKNQSLLRHPIAISDESGSILLGSAGGLKRASRLFESDETILMMNADEVFFTQNPEFLRSALEQHVSRNNLATLIVMKHPEAGQKFGAIWCDEKHRVKTILTAKSKPAETSELLTPWHYIGVIFLNKKILTMIPDHFESNIFYDILVKELSNNSVETFNLDCSWYETGNPADYLSATKKILSALDKSTLDFINQYDPSHLVRNENGFSLVSDSILISESKLQGYNVISQSTVPQNLTKQITNSVLFEDKILNSGYFS